MSEAQALPSIDYVSISPETNCRGLRCTNNDINRWFARRALKEHSAGSIRVKCAVEHGRPHRPLAFYAVATVAEEISSLPGRYHPFRSSDYFSALQLVWLATDHAYVGRGLGEMMVGQVIRLFAEVGPRIGLPHLIVTPSPSDHARLTRFYGKLGFTSYKGGEAMFLPVQSAIAAVAAIEAELAAEAVAAPNPQPEVE